jgi:hypothetical protein
MGVVQNRAKRQRQSPLATASARRLSTGEILSPEIEAMRFAIGGIAPEEVAGKNGLKRRSRIGSTR